MSQQGTTVTIRDWRELVEKADDENRHRDSLYPIVYEFGFGITRRDSGPDGGPYNNP